MAIATLQSNGSVKCGDCGSDNPSGSISCHSCKAAFQVVNENGVFRGTGAVSDVPSSRNSPELSMVARVLIGTVAGASALAGQLAGDPIPLGNIAKWIVLACGLVTAIMAFAGSKARRTMLTLMGFSLLCVILAAIGSRGIPALNALAVGCVAAAFVFLLISVYFNAGRVVPPASPGESDDA